MLIKQLKLRGRIAWIKSRHENHPSPAAGFFLITLSISVGNASYKESLEELGEGWLIGSQVYNK